MKKFKVVIVSLLVFAVLFIGGLSQKSSAATFNDFKTAVGINNYNIDLTTWGFSNPLVWTSTITNIASSGTIRGASGVDVSTLSGKRLYQGFILAGTESARKGLVFVGNIRFDLFRSTYNGGAIYSFYSAIIFNNSSISFIGNAAWHGGALPASNSSITFSNSSVSFIGNSANYGGAISGGAIESGVAFGEATIYYVAGHSSISFNNSSVSFTGNSAYRGGGAISASYSSITFSNSSISFIGNSADDFGGAIYSYYSTITFSNSSISFIGNSAGHSVDGYSGGAIHGDGHPESNISFNNSSVNFTGNSAYNGGAIYYGGLGLYIMGYVRIEKTMVSFSNSSVSFIGNSAYRGGAIYATRNMLFNNSKVNFINNTAESSGGAFYIVESSVSFNLIDSDILFSGNKANGINNDFYLTYSSYYSTSASYLWGVGSTVVFNIGYSRAVNLGGGILGYSGTLVKKTGAGVLNFLANSNTLFRGAFEINAGAVVFSTSAKISTMTISAGATLGLSVDFTGNSTTVLYLSSINISPASNLSIHTIGSVSNSSKAVIYTNNTAGEPTAFTNINSGGSYIYTFDWLTGTNGYHWTGYLTYGGVSGAWNAFVASYRTSSTPINLRDLITAVYGDSPIPFGTPANTITVDGRNNNINSNHQDDLGFVFNGTSITLKNVNLKKFNKTISQDNGNGGAIYADGASQITIIDSNFQNNTAIANGGVIYAGGTSKVLLKAQNANIVFENNQANSANNDIYLTDTAELELNAASNKTITMKGGILGGGGAINKKGNGGLIFGNNAKLDYKGNFNIQAGIAKMPIPTITISTLTIGTGAKLSLVDSRLNSHFLYVGSATISGIFDIGLNLSSLNPDTSVNNIDMLISSNSITINAGSFLNISGIFGAWSTTGSVKIMESQIGIENWNLLSFDDTYYGISYDETNKSLFLRVLSNPTPIPPTPSIDIIARNKFISNTLSLSAQSHGLDDIYNRIDSRAPNQKGNAWVGLYGGGKTADEFSVNSFGGAIGVDVYESKNLMGGIFVRYGSNDIKENDNKGAMGEIEFGIYGGLFEIKNSPINLKANISMGIQSYSMEAGETIDFDGKSIKGGFELEIISKMSKTTKLKPFVGVQGGLSTNDDIKTSETTIKSDNLLRAETKAGIGISGTLGQTQNFKWYSRLYGIFLVSGDEPKYKTTDNAGNESEIIGAKEDTIQGAISLGGEYQVGKAVSIFINAGADFGTGFGWTSGLGANYKF